MTEQTRRDLIEHRNQSVHQNFLEVEQGHIYYEKLGKGHPLILIHASGLNCSMWDEQTSFLSRHYQVIRYDLRNLGLSTSEPGQFPYHEDLYALIQHLDIPAAHLIGLAGGAAIAIDFALAYPERVANLVLISPTLSGSKQRVYTPEEKAFLLSLPASNSDEMAAFMLRKWVDGPLRTPEDVQPLARQQAQALYRQTFSQRKPLLVFPQIPTPPAIDRLGNINALTQILTGAYDFQAIQENALTLKEAIPEAHLVTLPNVGHLINIEAPDVFNQLVHHFLSPI